MMINRIVLLSLAGILAGMLLICVLFQTRYPNVSIGFIMAVVWTVVVASCLTGAALGKMPSATKSWRGGLLLIDVMLFGAILVVSATIWGGDHPDVVGFAAVLATTFSVHVAIASALKNQSGNEIASIDNH